MDGHVVHGDGVPDLDTDLSFPLVPGHDHRAALLGTVTGAGVGAVDVHPTVVAHPEAAVHCVLVHPDTERCVRGNIAVTHSIGELLHTCLTSFDLTCVIKCDP